MFALMFSGFRGFPKTLELINVNVFVYDSLVDNLIDPKLILPDISKNCLTDI